MYVHLHYPQVVPDDMIFFFSVEYKNKSFAECPNCSFPNNEIMSRLTSSINGL